MFLDHSGLSLVFEPSYIFSIPSLYSLSLFCFQQRGSPPQSMKHNIIWIRSQILCPVLLFWKFFKFLFQSIFYVMPLYNLFQIRWNTNNLHISSNLYCTNYEVRVNLIFNAPGNLRHMVSITPGIAADLSLMWTESRSLGRCGPGTRGQGNWWGVSQEWTGTLVCLEEGGGVRVQANFCTWSYWPQPRLRQLLPTADLGDLIEAV